MDRPTRRQALQELSLGALTLTVGIAGIPRPARCVDLRDLARRLGASSHAGAFDVAAGAVRAGASWADVLGAAYLAGVRDISPRPVGNALHAVLMVESSFLLGYAASEAEALGFAFWNLDHVKRSQDDDRQGGDWRLPPPPEKKLAGVETSRRELTRAMEAWDLERADVAITSLVAQADRRACFEVLWPYVARSSVDLGHKAVLGAHTDRVLARIGWEHAESAMRALVRSLLHTRGAARFDQTFQSARELSETLPDSWDRGADSTGGSLELMRAVRRKPWKEAQREVVAALQCGLGVKAVWDGLRLFAHDTLLCRAGASPMTGEALGPVHPVTALSSLAHAFRSATADAARHAILLAAPGWVCALRDELAQRVSLRMGSRGIEELLDPAEEPVPAEELFQTRAPSPAMARAHLSGDPARWKGYCARLRRELARRAVETHQMKYAAALFEDAALSHERWRPALLAGALPYLPNEREPESEVHERTVHALRNAGVW